ncbi:MAG TPA: hypothetical protein VKT49_10945 [Bryobacteraceae bacterium]|nr:hypothetical protein [Bryobacteraceae bacterium]
MKEFLGSLEQSGLGSWVRDAPTIWAFPTILFLHTLGMAIVAGGSAMISVIVLGFWPAAPVKPFARMFPWMWIAFGINAVTGTMMLIADATNKMTNLDFYIKMVFVFAGFYLLIRMRRQVFENPQIDQVPLSGSAKWLAWASLACWFGAITAGRLLAYVGPGSANAGGAH